MEITSQHTLSHAVQCRGIGLHSGEPVHLRLLPAEIDGGITFVRSDITDRPNRIPAAYDHVTDTRLGTTLENEAGVKVATVEHLMAALWGCGIDNAVIELDGPEVPIMDGSSEPFVFLIECTGTVEQNALRRHIEVLKPITVRNADAIAIIEPCERFLLDIEIDFPHRLIARQRAVYDFSYVSFKQMLARARTFGFAKEVEQLRSAGLARGGSLDNAIVIGDNQILNQDGLRYRDEFVRHKALDCVGDYFLAGGYIQGAVTTSHPGHAINNQLMRALMEDDEAWRYTIGIPTTPFISERAVATA